MIEGNLKLNDPEIMLFLFLDEISSNQPKNFYPTSKTYVYHIVDIGSADILDPKAYGPEKKKIQIFFNYDRQFVKK